MNTGKTVFSQVMEFLPLHEFRKCVERYHGDYKVQSFSCMDQRPSLPGLYPIFIDDKLKNYYLFIMGIVYQYRIFNTCQKYRQKSRQNSLDILVERTIYNNLGHKKINMTKLVGLIP